MGWGWGFEWGVVGCLKDEGGRGREREGGGGSSEIERGRFGNTCF